MEPISLSVIATLLLTKAIEKTGETIGEKALEQVGRLKRLLHSKSPETATAIEAVAQHPELAEANSSKYSTSALAEQLQKAANRDPEIAEAIQNTVNACPQNMQHSIIDIVTNNGVVAPGGVFSNSTFNF